MKSSVKGRGMAGNHQKSWDELRRRAEEILRKKGSSHAGQDDKDNLQLLEELSIHQIELEMQNDELQRARQILEEERDRYRELYDYAPVPYITVNQTGNIIRLNYAAADLFGRPREIFNLNSIFPFISADSRTSFRHLMHQAFETRDFLSGEVSFLLPDSREYPAKLHFISYYDSSYEKELCRITITGIAEERRAFESELKYVETRFRELFDRIDEGIYVTRGGVLIDVNPAFAALFGYTREELIGMPAWELAVPDNRREVYTIFMEKAGTGDTTPVELECQRKDGARFWAEISINTFTISGETFGIARDITRKKEERRLLEEERAQFIELLDTIPEAIYVASRESHRILFANRTARDQFGEDLVGELCYKALQDCEEPCSFCTNDIIFSRREPWFWEHYNEKTNRHYYMIDKAIVWHDGQEARFQLAIDITTVKEAQSSLAESEERYRLLADNSSDVIAMYDGHFNPLYISPSSKRQSGYEPEEMDLSVIENLIHPDDAAAFNEEVKEVLKEKRSFAQYKYRIRHRDGHYIWIESNSRYIYNDENILERVLVNNRDITERMEAEEATAIRLRYENGITVASRELLEALGGSLDRALEAIREASGACRMYIFENTLDERGDLCMMQTYEVTAPGISPQMRNDTLSCMHYRDGFLRWKDMLSRDVPVHGRINDLPRDEQQVLRAQNIKSILVLPLFIEGQWRGFIGFDDTIEGRNWGDDDISLLRTAAGMVSSFLHAQETHNQILHQKEQLELLNTTKDRLFSIIAHDLKNPMGGIIGFTELLTASGDALSEEDRKEYIRIVHDSTRQTLALLENLLLWAQTQTGESVYRPEQVAMDEVIQNAMELYSHIAKKKDISIKLNLECSSPQVTGDRGMLGTVMRNLIANAVKFTPRGGTVTVGCTLDEEGARFYVADTGKGIEPERLERIFELNVKGSTPGTENEKGTGLGLILCHEFISLHNGTLEAGNNESGGAIFSFTLPK